MVKLITALLMLAGTSLSTTAALATESLASGLQFNPAYVTDLARQSNAASVNATQTVRQALKGEPASIPSDWRLVNVIAKGNDFVMFFQAGDASVRSLRMQADGALSGQDMVWLKARQ